MTRFVVRRVVESVAIVFIVATTTFVLLHIAPGDPVSAQYGDRPIAPEIIARYRADWGLDRPLPVQYVRYLGRLARGDLGHSFSLQRPVRDVIGGALPNTLILSIAALAVSFAVGIAVGTVQGARPRSRVDNALSASTLMIFSVPIFWLGLMLLLVFGQILGWFPIGTNASPFSGSLPFWSRVADRLHHLVLPAVTLGLGGAAVIARFHRAEMTEAFAEAFIRTARAKGLPERRVVTRHALRNALLPAITIFGLSLPVLVSGAVLVETVFAWPGMGRAAVDAVARRDYNVVTGIAILGATFVILGNAVADLLYRWLDPRTVR